MREGQLRDGEDGWEELRRRDALSALHTRHLLTSTILQVGEMRKGNRIEGYVSSKT